jgi:hypothetical protein
VSFWGTSPWGGGGGGGGGPPPPPPPDEVQSISETVFAAPTSSVTVSA